MIACFLLFNLITHAKAKQRKLFGFFLFPTFSMEIFMHIAELFVGDVGVNLGGGDAGVAKHGLHRTDVGAVT